MALLFVVGLLLLRLASRRAVTDVGSPGSAGDRITAGAFAWARPLRPVLHARLQIRSAYHAVPRSLHRIDTDDHSRWRD